MNENDQHTGLGEISSSVKEYADLKIEEYKLKSVENLSLLSNKVTVILIATMIGAVILQLLGFAFAFLIGELLGSTALGFVIIAVLFAIGLLVVYIKRDSLFINKMVRLYMKMFFGNNNTGKL